MAEPVLLTAWIDFLCPWSWVVTTRLERFAQEYGDLVELEWRGFMRYPQKENRELGAWRASTKEWLEPAMAEGDLNFSLWVTTNPPPTHSAPALVAALVAADVDPERAPDYWRALFRAHFAENRTISDTGTLIGLARQVGLDDDAFAMTYRGRYADYVKQVIDDHNEGLRRGITDTPAVVIADEFLVRGTPTIDQLRDVVDQVLEARGVTPPRSAEPEPAPEPEKAEPEPEVKAAPEPEVASEAEANVEPEAKAKADKPEPDAKPDPDAKPEPEPAEPPEQSEPASKAAAKPAPSAPAKKKAAKKKPAKSQRTKPKPTPKPTPKSKPATAPEA